MHYRNKQTRASAHASLEVSVCPRQMHGPPGFLSNHHASCLLSLAACLVRVCVSGVHLFVLVPLTLTRVCAWPLLPGKAAHQELVTRAEGRAYLL